MKQQRHHQKVSISLILDSHWHIKSLCLLQHATSWLWLEVFPTIKKLNYGPNQIPNAPCPISPKKLGVQLDSGPHKDPQFVVDGIQEEA